MVSFLQVKVSDTQKSLTPGAALRMQVGSHRIRGTPSAEFMATDAASQLAAASEQDLTAALAQLRLNQQQQAAAAAAANGYGSAPGCVTALRQAAV